MTKTIQELKIDVETAQKALYAAIEAEQSMCKHFSEHLKLLAAYNSGEQWARLECTVCGKILEFDKTVKVKIHV